MNKSGTRKQKKKNLFFKEERKGQQAEEKSWDSAVVKKNWKWNAGTQLAALYIYVPLWDHLMLLVIMLYYLVTRED